MTVIISSIMVIKSGIDDFGSEVQSAKIAKALADLTSPTNTQLFIHQMVSLSVLLSSFCKVSDKTFSDIDANAQDPTYFLASYFDTGRIDEALWVYKIVRSLTRYILLSDRYYETGNHRYALLAKRTLSSVKRALRLVCNTQHLVYSLDCQLEQFAQFWQLEQIVKARIIKNYSFSYAEIRHFNLSKSSDASLVYSKVLDAKLPSFNENVSLVLHYKQALLDIQDDLEDIEQDIIEEMPNIFVMAALNCMHYNKIRESASDRIRKVVFCGTGSSQHVRRLVDELQTSVKSISVPENFAFLKILSDLYADTLKRKLTLTIPQ